MQTYLKTPFFAPYVKVIKVLALAFVLAALAVCIMFLPFMKKEALKSPLFALASYIITFGIVFWIIKKRLSPGKKIKILDMPHFDSKVFVQLLFIFILFTTLTIVLAFMVELPSTSADTLKAYFEANQIIFFVNTVVAAPILEELIFRGVILRYLLEHLKPTLAILFSSFLFGLIHFSPDQMLFAFLSGIFLGYTYFKSNNLLMPIIFHALNNAIVFFALVIFLN